MILIVLAGLCLLSVPLTGGRLGRLASVRLRGLWVPVIPWPGPLPNVLSVGDCLIYVGTLVLLHRTCGRRAPEPIRLSPLPDGEDAQLGPLSPSPVVAAG